MFIQTERLNIRPFIASDLDDIYAYMSDEETSYYIEQGCLDRQATEQFLHDNLSSSAKCYALELNDSDKVVGHVEFYPCFGEHTYEIGWIIHPSFQRQGYAFEATNSLITKGFEELAIHRIIATCQPDNHASYRLMEKLGMVREGHFIKCIPKPNGVWWDEYAYAILKEDYKAY